MISHFIKIACAVQFLQTVSAFLNGFEQDLSFTCPGKHQTISHIESVHRDSHEDRQFDISCSDVLDSTETNTDCFWTGYANYFDHTLASQCPDNYFINGVTSHFEKCCKDRIWKFYCCKIQGYNLVNCDTTSWNNKFDLVQNFTVPAGRFLKSVTSIYKDHYGDREFKFETCDWTVNDPIDQQRDYGKLVHPGNSFVNDWDKELLFECPDKHHSIVYVESAHENYFDDRVYKLACVDVVQNIRNRAVNCSWSAEVNKFEEDLAYSCPGNSFIQGMRSYHDNTKEDRVWRYKCCQVKGIGIGNCKIEDWTNLFDNYQRYIIPDSTVMAGVISQFADEQKRRHHKKHSGDRDDMSSQTDADRRTARTMRLVSVGTQAGIFDTRLISGFIVDLLQKLHEIHQTYQSCSEDLERGRKNLDDTEKTMADMESTLGTVTENVDSLGVHLLEEGVSLSNKNIAVAKMRKEVALRRSQVEELSRNMPCPKEHGKRQQRLNELRNERAKLEIQLTKLNNDIDSTYEEMYDAEERLYGIRDLRESRRAEHSTLMESMQEKCSGMQARKAQILSSSNANTMMDMRDIYVSPAQFTQIQADIDLLKDRQVQIDRHIQMQLEEREHLRSTADEIVQKVYDLERKVRKEKGDHGFDSRRSEEPCWHQDLGTPTIWFSSPGLTLDQLRMIMDKQSRQPRYSLAQPETEVEEEHPGNSAESAESGEENVMTIDLLKVKESQL